MNPRLQRQEKKLGPTFIVSLLCHLVVILVCARLNILGAITLSSAPVYYVDVVNLPVAHPQAAESAGGAAAPELAPAPPPSTPPAMKLPAKAAEQAKRPQAKAPAAPATTAPGSKRETSREFEERLARLERSADTRRQAAAIEALRKKVASGAAGTGGPAGRAGAPGASGTQAGSYYETYIRSRMEDAFRVEDTFKPDATKVMLVRITIGRNGKIASLQVERKSGDKMFNDAVMRTIARAEKDFPPTPDGAQVELQFLFRPQEVSKQ